MKYAKAPAIVSEFISYQRWLGEQSLSPRSKECYTGAINRFIEWYCKNGHWTFSTIADPNQVAMTYYLYLHDDLHLKGSSINTYMSALSSLFVWMGRGPLHVPVEPVRRAVVQELGQEDRQRIELFVSTESLQCKVLFVLLTEGGFRTITFQRLNMSDICFDETGRAAINRGFQRQFQEVASAILSQWVTGRNECKDGPLFAGRKNTRISNSALSGQLRKTLIRGGFSCTPEQLRKSWKGIPVSRCLFTKETGFRFTPQAAGVSHYELQQSQFAQSPLVGR